MGSLLCCFCEEEENYFAEENERNGVEEITLEELNAPENPQGPEYVEMDRNGLGKDEPIYEELDKKESGKDEPIYEELDKYRPESPEYLEMVRRSPSYISVCEPTRDESPETFRLRVIAEQCRGTESEFRKFYDSTITMTPDMDSSKIECLSHVSAYSTEMERIMDATYINALKPNTLPEYVIYSKATYGKDVWQLDISFGDSPKVNRRFLISPMNTVQVWAMITRVKDGKEDHGVLHLSSKPYNIKLAQCMKNLTARVVHTTAYNLDAKKIRDMVTFEANKREAGGLSSKDSETGKIFQATSSPH